MNFIIKSPLSLIAGLALTFLPVNHSLADDRPPEPAWRSEGIFISDARIHELKRRVAECVEPTYSAYLECKRMADEGLDRRPEVPEKWFVPPFYQDVERHRARKGGLETDANTAYVSALLYRLTGEEKYARTAVRLLNAWAELEDLSRAADSLLVFSYHFPAFLFAADLLDESGVWKPAGREKFRAFVREKAVHQNTMARRNNQGNWGLVHVMACAVYLEDAVLFEKAVERWKEFVEKQIAEDGSLPHEVRRNKGSGRHGLWYSHFTLLPQTIAAEIARLNGVDLYDYVAPNGRTLRQAYETLAAWARFPETFPFYSGDPEDLHRPVYASYFEILNERWPHPDARAVLEESRPMTAQQTAPCLTFTHGGLEISLDTCESGKQPALSD